MADLWKNQILSRMRREDGEVGCGMTKEEIISNLLYMKHSVKEDTIEDITINEAIKVLQQEPCTDAISRQAVLEKIHEAPYINDCSNIGMLLEAWINSIPSVKPQYTDAEIQKMQDIEFAEIQKAYEIGKAENIEVLDKIRAEIDEQYDKVHPYNISCAEGLEMALEIIDKYKASPTGAESEA